MAVCILDQVSKTYRSSMLLKRIPVLKDISLTVEPGETFAYLGHNGAGKTTTIKALLGLIRVDRGTVQLHGADAGSLAARAKTGYLPENPYFYDHLTALEFLELAADLHGLTRRDGLRRRGEVLDMVGMADRASARMRSYSKGMLQRIGLAQALIGDPDLVILDEPMGGLDPVGRHQVRTILEELHRRGKTLFMSSHILADVESLADRAAIISRGELRRIVDLAELRVEGRVMQVRVRGLTVDDQRKLNAAGLSLEDLGNSQVVEVDDPARLAGVIEQIHAIGGELLQVTPKRRTLEEIFLKEVQTDATPGPEQERINELTEVLT